MKQTYVSLATKINNNATMYGLQVTSYLFGSKFEGIFTSRKLCVVLNFTSSHDIF